MLETVLVFYNISEALFVEDRRNGLLPPLDVEEFPLPARFMSTRKYVFAFRPLIKMAASSYARAASSAVSNVPSHTKR
ncbi:hypothetical protein V6N13_093944 [Hibiscus sabdariffa]|uniref:Uncharacterized protein n=1 Tax=Hibiscus sabdariffa TaxID=183260 RepID=A0ABR2NL52_9ROSI